MSKQWLVALGVIATLALGGFALTRANDEGIVGVGARAPDARVEVLATGDTVALRDFVAGHVTLVNIWATWCGPCRAEMPSMEALYKDYAARGFKIAAVSIDEGSADPVRAFVRQYALTFDILHDPTGAIQGVYQTTGVPESFLLDRDGRIVARKIGAHDWNSAANRQLLDRLLADGS
ncbi:MAG TPA: TlpA disulfide reductase family protein [Gemmatimonadales bacterium]|nr:TlpA disulfide reductase family protein [Gemmatimonadales bacterium]